VIIIMNVWVILSAEQIIVLGLSTHLQEIVVKNLLPVPQPLQQPQLFLKIAVEIKNV